MYPVSDKWKEKIYSDGIKSKINIYINEQLVDVKILELKISHTLYNDDSSIILGTTTSQSLELKLYKKDLPANLNIVKIDYGILVDDEYEIIPLGVYNVESVDDTNNATITIKARDNMIKFESNYDGSTLNYPATLKTVLLDICSKVGVQLGTATFLNENNEIAVWDNTIKAREYLSYIAEKAGCIAVIGRDGKLYLKNIYESSEALQLRLFKKYEWGEKHTITRVKYQDGIRSYNLGDASGNTLWINSNNMFVNSASEIESIYDVVNGLTAYSFESGTTRINPALDVGDKVVIDGKPVIYQYDIELKGRFLGNINSKLSDKAKEDTTVKKVSSETKIRRVQSEINQIDGKITQLVQETDENTEKITKNEQDIASINQTVSSFTNFTKTVEGKVKILLEDALNTNILKLILHAENTDNGVFPSEYLYPSEDLYPQNAGNEITILVENEDRTESREFFYNCIYPLSEYNGIHDQLVIEFDKDKGCCIVKALIYVKEIGEDTFEILDTPEEIILDDNLQLTLFKGNNYISIKEYQNWNIEATYIFNNELNELYATQVYMSSVIKQIADEILLEVSKKVGDEELIAKINLTPETIKIIASKLALEGYTTINGGFSIDEKGNASIANGAVVINSDGIRMADGTSILGGKGLITNLEYIGHSNMNDTLSGTFGQVGFRVNSLNSSNFKAKVIIDAYIPENFTIEKAIIVMNHFPLDVRYQGTSKGKGYSRNVKVYKESINSISRVWNIDSSFFDIEESYGEEINIGLENNLWQPEGNGLENISTTDIGKYLVQGNNRLVIASSDAIPSYSTSNYGINNQINCALKTGMISATLQIYGFMKPESEE